MYGVLYYRVQLCLAAISMLVFFTPASQRKNDCKYNFRVFHAVFSSLSILVLIEELVIYIILFFLNFESLKVLQKKGRKNHSVVWAVLPQNCSLLFIFVHLWMKTDLIEKERSRKINCCSFMVSLLLLNQLYYTIFVCLLLILWILNSCSIFVTMCTFAQFWGMFNKEKYRVNSFAQNIWITNFQCNEFIETRYTALLLKVPGVNKILTHRFFSIWL